MAEKEVKFLVLKLADVKEYLTEGEVNTFSALLFNIGDKRRKAGKVANKYIVCNEDETYAKLVWDIVLKGENKKELAKAKVKNLRQPPPSKNFTLAIVGTTYIILLIVCSLLTYIY